MIAYAKMLVDNYEAENKPAPEDVTGIPMTFDVDGKEVYCLHYPSRNRIRGPVFIDIHGGGMVWGYPEEDDLFCARVSELLDIEIYSLEYPRGPKNPYPTAINYLYDVIRYMTQHAEKFNFDPKQVAIGGHSAGGNFTAALMLRNQKEKAFDVKCQVLAYPAIDMRRETFPPGTFKDDPCGLTDELMAFFTDAYFEKDEDMQEIYGNPILAERKNLIGQPPTVLLTCECDQLRISGEKYGAKLVDAGVPVFAHEYPGAPHAFEVFPGPLMRGGQDFITRGLKLFLEI